MQLDPKAADQFCQIDRQNYDGDSVLVTTRTKLLTYTTKPKESKSLGLGWYYAIWPVNVSCLFYSSWANMRQQDTSSGCKRWKRKIKPWNQDHLTETVRSFAISVSCSQVGNEIRAVIATVVGNYCWQLHIKSTKIAIVSRWHRHEIIHYLSQRGCRFLFKCHYITLQSSHQRYCRAHSSGNSSS